MACRKNISDKRIMYTCSSCSKSIFWTKFCFLRKKLNKNFHCPTPMSTWPTNLQEILLSGSVELRWQTVSVVYVNRRNFRKKWIINSCKYAHVHSMSSFLQSFTNFRWADSGFALTKQPLPPPPPQKKQDWRTDCQTGQKDYTLHNTLRGVYYHYTLIK